MSRIAFLDFDGTITHKDSFLEFIKYSKGKSAFFLGFLLYSPVLVAYKLKIISNQRAKEIMIRHFFGNMPLAHFQELCDNFSREVVPSLIRPKAVTEINKLKEAGAEIVIVSASAENWVKYWCAEIGARWIATRLELCDSETISGKLKGKNCYGIEKVRRIRELYNLERYEEIYCYGDTEGDKPMLELATISFFKPFR